ncbi:MAG: DUF167 domain-containing protein [Bryobacterales bacterium]|nr:DUF167 domain-containing protein [Bryobacterales bacterium]
MSVRITVKVHPRAKRTRLVGLVGDMYKIEVAAPPIEGRANEACVKFLADVLGIPKSAIRVASGTTGRVKLLDISGVSEEVIRTRLAS